MAEEDFEERTEPLPPLKEREIPSLLINLKQLGPYKIESLLQSGGMSLLYLATDSEHNLPVVVKVLLPKFASRPDIVERFLREAEILALVDHPNIVKMCSHGQWEGGYYIALELIKGGSLRQFLMNTPLSLKRALEMILEIAYAICHLHTHGIIHRDLKLENILVTEDGSIKLIDFGIAQLLDDIKIGECAVFRHRTIGTPIYMSPEQLKNPDKVSYPSDIYSLGIIAYELVLGKFSQGHVHLSLMPRGLQRILAKALQPNPKERYQDIVDFIADLSGYLNSDALQKERKVGDRAGELFDNLQQAIKGLFPKTVPHWPSLEIGLAVNVPTLQRGIYGDFIELDQETFAFVFGESLADDAKGIILNAMMRGIVRTSLKKQVPLSEFANVVNRYLLEDPTCEPFALCCLVVSTSQKQASFISCGYGVLWHLPKDAKNPQRIKSINPCLKSAEEFSEVVFPFDIGDQLFLCATTDKISEIESTLSQVFSEQEDLPSQQKADRIAHKLKMMNKESSLHVVLTLNHILPD